MEQNSDLPALLTPILALKQGSCFSCWNTARELKRCAACKRVSYCSQSCQKKDWNAGHKKICKFLIVSNKTRTPVPVAGRTWEGFFKEKINEIRAFKDLSPMFDKNLERLILYEAYCSHCYRRQSQLDPGAPLKNCDACKIASFCPDCPQTHGTEECQSFHEVAEDEKWTIEHNKNQMESGQPTLTIVCTQNPRETYLPLSTAAGWYDYYTKISDKDISDRTITKDLKPGSDDPQEVGAAGYLRSGTRATSIPLTILAALEKIFPNITERTSLKLHLIGVDPWELERMMVFEEILHLLPTLKHLHLTLVGLDIPKEAVSEDVLILKCCPPCTSMNRQRSISLFRSPYHDFITTKYYELPELAIAFQSGFSQEARESWMPTIRHLATAQHHTLFTTYNKEEMREECAIFRTLGAEFVQEGEVNKWKSVCPILEPMGSTEDNVYYSNQYWYIIKKHKDQ